MSAEDIEEMVLAADSKGDGEINYEGEGNSRRIVGRIVRKIVMRIARRIVRRIVKRIMIRIMNNVVITDYDGIVMSCL